MKKVYVMPSMAAVEFQVEDIITTSGGATPEPGVTTKTASLDLQEDSWKQVVDIF